MYLSAIFRLLLSQDTQNILLGEQQLQARYPQLLALIYQTIADLTTATNLDQMSKRVEIIRFCHQQTQELLINHPFTAIAYNDGIENSMLTDWGEVMMAAVTNYMNRICVGKVAIGSYSMVLYR